jgi:uncharacterized protein YebE (UPF0316 family)
VEILIWLVVIRQVMANMSNPVCFIAYAAGFSAGTYVGIVVENRLPLGAVMIRIVTRGGGKELGASLRREGYGVTEVETNGGEGPVDIIFTVVRRQDIGHVEAVIAQVNPEAFCSIEDVRFVGRAVRPRMSEQRAMQPTRKGK